MFLSYRNTFLPGTNTLASGIFMPSDYKREKWSKQHIHPFALSVVWSLCRVRVHTQQCGSERCDIGCSHVRKLNGGNHVWDNCSGPDCSLVAWIFCIPRYHGSYSHCPGCGNHTARSALHEARHCKRVETLSKTGSARGRKSVRQDGRAAST